MNEPDIFDLLDYVLEGDDSSFFICDSKTIADAIIKERRGKRRKEQMNYENDTV